jgi:hypothetical protein
MKTEEIEEKALTMTEQVTALAVVDKETYDLANSFGAAAKELLKAIDEAFDPIIEAAHKSHKTALEQKKKQSAPVEAVKKMVDAKMVAWYQAEKAKAEALQRAAEAAARKKAEDEALAQAQLLQDMGMDEAAEEALEAPVVLELGKTFEPEKAEGVSYRDSYSATVVNLMLLVKAVAAGTQPLACIEANMVTLNGFARTLKSEANIPGVRIDKTTSQVRR